MRQTNRYDRQTHRQAGRHSCACVHVCVCVFVYILYTYSASQAFLLIIWNNKDTNTDTAYTDGRIYIYFLKNNIGKNQINRYTKIGKMIRTLYLCKWQLQNWQLEFFFLRTDFRYTIFLSIWPQYNTSIYLINTSLPTISIFILIRLRSAQTI